MKIPLRYAARAAVMQFHENRLNRQTATPLAQVPLRVAKPGRRNRCFKQRVLQILIDGKISEPYLEQRKILNKTKTAIVIIFMIIPRIADRGEFIQFPHHLNFHKPKSVVYSAFIQSEGSNHQLK
ncbi:MAG TPA: hypothetical protein VK663_02675 [Burkholderiales bacterium]|nr:hypothetical protein [Burkholderiales bacterium]